MGNGTYSRTVTNHKYRDMSIHLKDLKNPMYLNVINMLDAHFQNYRVFHDKFLGVLKGADNHWRADIYEYLEELGISDYGLIKSINYINYAKSRIKVNDVEQKFKNAYFHFGLLFDTIDNILKCIIYTKQKLFGNENPLVKKTKKELMDKYEDWIEKKYESEYEKMVIQGMRSIYYYPQSNRDFLKQIVKNKKFRKEYKEYITEIKKYRNFFTHNPSIDVVNNSGNRYVILRKYLSQYRTLTEIRNGIRSFPEHFIDPVRQLDNDLKDTLRVVNRLWDYLIEEMDNLTAQAGYKSLINNYKR